MGRTRAQTPPAHHRHLLPFVILTRLICGAFFILHRWTVDFRRDDLEHLFLVFALGHTCRWDTTSETAQYLLSARGRVRTGTRWPVVASRTQYTLPLRGWAMLAMAAAAAVAARLRDLPLLAPKAARLAALSMALRPTRLALRRIALQLAWR